MLAILCVPFLFFNYFFWYSSAFGRNNLTFCFTQSKMSDVLVVLFHLWQTWKGNQIFLHSFIYPSVLLSWLIFEAHGAHFIKTLFSNVGVNQPTAKYSLKHKAFLSVPVLMFLLLFPTGIYLVLNFKTPRIPRSV